MRRLVIAVVLLAACSKDLDQLSPFPCPLSGQCPSGLTCIEQQCVAPRIGGRCEVGDRDVCSLIGPGVQCVVGDVRQGIGTCEPTCGDAGCEAGRVCVIGVGVCLLDCTADASSCPPDTECAEREVDGRQDGRVCVPRGAPTVGGECFDDANCSMLAPGSICAVPARELPTSPVPVFGRCARTCANDGDCAVDEVCQTTDGRLNCGKRCTSTVDCDGGDECVFGGCVLKGLGRPGERCKTSGCANEPMPAPQTFCRPIDGVARCTPQCLKGVACPTVPAGAMPLSCVKDDEFNNYWCEARDPDSASCSIASPSLLGLVGLGFLLFPRRRRPRQSRGA